MFEKGSSESSEGIIPEVNETNVDSKEVVSQGDEKLPPKKVEGTPEWYQSQLDKTVKKVLGERENAWAQERAEYQKMFQAMQTEFQTIKNPPIVETLTPPKPPADPTDPLQVLAYNAEMTDYRFKMLDKKLSKIDNIEKSVQQEREEKIQRQRYEANKAALLGKYQEAGLSAEEALECYQFGEKPEGVTPENIVALYKITKGIPIQFKDNGNKVREKDNFKMPPGVGGSSIPEANESQSFMNEIGNDKFKGLFDKK